MNADLLTFIKVTKFKVRNLMLLLYSAF